MLKDITLGQFFPGNSAVHRLDPRVKIVLTVAFIVLLFLAQGPVSYALIIAFLAVVIGISRISPKMVLRGLKPILFIVIFTAVLNLFFVTGEGEPLNALQMLSELCELAVVKVGIKGALIKRGSEVVHVGIMAAAKRVDTTGAGDLYAAGFLSGLCEGLTLRQCGTIGAIVAGKVIEVVGTTFSEEAWQHAFQLVEKVRSEKYLF